MPERSKKYIFAVVAASLPFILLVVLELFLRSINYSGDWSVFVKAESPYEHFYRVNPNVGKRYFGKQNTLPTPPNDLFLQKKPQDSYRIVVLGGSTALGFPYGNLLMFSRILHRRLQDTFPEKRIEVINTALTAVNSWALLDFTDEILRIDPDLILIYAGHNEYYGALGVGSVESVGRSRFLIRSHLYLNRFRTVRLLRDGFRKLPSLRLDSSTNGTLMERITKQKDIPMVSDLYTAGIEQYDKNLAVILSAYQNANIPVIISELVDNQFMRPLDAQAQIESSIALAEFEKAETLLTSGKVNEAKEGFRYARDLDVIRFRAPTEMNNIIHKHANKFQAILASTQKAFEQSSAHGIIDDELMADHLHPNIEGCFLMADVFYRTMKSHQLISSEWDSNVLPAEWYHQNWPISKIDSTIADLITKNLKDSWPFRPLGEEGRFLLDFKPESVEEQLALKVIQDELSTENAHFLLAEYYTSNNEIDKAIREYDVMTHLVYIEAYHFFWRAEAFIRQGKKKYAIEMLEQSLAREDIPMARQLYESLAETESPK